MTFGRDGAGGRSGKGRGTGGLQGIDIIILRTSRNPIAEVKEFDVYVPLTHTVLQCLLHITQDNSEVYNINKSHFCFGFFFSSLSSSFSA